MSDKPQYVPPPKNVLDNPKLRIDGPKLEGGKRRSQLSFELFRNNPRIAIYYNDERSKPTYARMEPESFFFFLDQLAEIAYGRRKTIKIRNKHNYDPQGNKLPQPDVVSQTVGGVDENTGKVFISVVEKDKPLVKFFFETNYWYNVVDENNTPLPDGDLSKALCLSKVKFLKALYPVVMSSTYEHPQRPQGGNNFGGQKRQGGGNYGGQKQGGGSGGGWNNNSNSAPASGGGMFDDIAI